jgi:hypothetical protein
VVVEMRFRRWITRLTREAEEGAVLVRLRDGSTRVFDDMTCWREMFLAKMSLAKEPLEPIHSLVLDAVRQATPESRAAFEAEYGSITPEIHIVCPEVDGGWVDVYRLEEDGTVTKVRHPGDTEEARRLREEARQQGPAF